jgi:ArsR family transcriptional regulator
MDLIPLKTRDILKDGSEDALATYCKALASPVRAKIIRILIQRGECFSGDIAEEFNLEHSSVSEHLKILKNVGLIHGTVFGKNRCYCVNHEALKRFKSVVSEL